MDKMSYEPFTPNRLRGGEKYALNQFGANKHGEFNLQTGDFIPWDKDAIHDTFGYCEDHMMWPTQTGHKEKHGK